MQPNKNLAVPLLPQRIGLITAKNSAAANDFIQTLSRSPFGFQIFLANSTMQGNQTEVSILRAMACLEYLHPDLVVIIRGGGGKTDPASLDNEAIARRIAGYRYPVWTGIGHETDMGIPDYVAHTYFKTPTAAAGELVARYVEADRFFVTGRDRLATAWSHRLETEKKRMTGFKKQLSGSTAHYMERIKNRFRDRAGQLKTKISGRISSQNLQIRLFRERLFSLSKNTLNSHRQKLSEKTAGLIRKNRVIISETEKTLDGFRKRFRADRFLTGLKFHNQQLSARSEQIKRYFSVYLKQRRTNLKLVQNRFRAERFLTGLKIHNRELASCTERIKRNSVMHLKQHRGNLAQIQRQFRKEPLMNRIRFELKSLADKTAMIKAHDPETVLERGYALVFSENGEVLKSVNRIKPGDRLKTKMRDGVVAVTADQIKRSERQ